VNTIREEHSELFDDELSQRIAHEAGQAFIAESKIIDWILGDFNQPGLNADILKEFIKNRINTSLRDIGFEPVFETNEELLDKTAWFDELLLGNTATDFFHARPIEYSKNNKSFDEASLF